VEKSCNPALGVEAGQPDYRKVEVLCIHGRGTANKSVFHSGLKHFEGHHKSLGGALKRSEIECFWIFGTSLGATRSQFPIEDSSLTGSARHSGRRRSHRACATKAFCIRSRLFTLISPIEMCEMSLPEPLGMCSKSVSRPLRIESSDVILDVSLNPETDGRMRSNQNAPIPASCRGVE
jgi:hypothetical protein